MPQSYRVDLNGGGHTKLPGASKAGGRSQWEMESIPMEEISTTKGRTAMKLEGIVKSIKPSRVPVSASRLGR